MPQLARLVIGTAALLFIGVSATMNALFLSSLGRTAIETGLLICVSLTADMTKAVLPVALLRALVVRAWGEASVALIMLVCVTALSLASGTGFAALTREAATGARSAQIERTTAQRAHIQRLEARLATSQILRSTAAMEVDVSAAMLDRRWQSSNGCASPASQTLRAFCTETLKLKSALADARERDRLDAELQAARTTLDTLQRGDTANDSDPQATAIAALFGIDRAWPRVVLVSSLTIILELGSICLVLLASGSALRAAPSSQAAPTAPLMPAEIPGQADRTFWHRERAVEGTSSIRDRITGFGTRDIGT